MLEVSVNSAISDMQNSGTFDTLSRTSIVADLQLLVLPFLATLVDIGL